MGDSGNMSDVLSQLPNPFTPMAFLPPDLAYQVTVSVYVLVGSLAVLVWDVLSNLHDDVKLLTRHRIRLSVAIYFISRLSCLAYLTALVVLQTAPVGHCENIRKIQALYPIALPSTSLLFFIRVRALYANNKWVIGLFSLSWLGVLAGCITATQGISGSAIGPTKYCLNSRLESYVSLAGIFPTINDTLVLVATTWALMHNSWADLNVRNGVKVMVMGKYLPVFSKAILQDGQAYYLTTVGLNLVVVSMFYNTHVPIVYRSFFGVPNIVLMNIMACHVYRKVRFGIIAETTVVSMGSMGSKGGNQSLQSSGRGSGGQKPASGLVFERNSNLRSTQFTDRTFMGRPRDVDGIRMEVVKLETTDDDEPIMLRENMKGKVGGDANVV